MGNYNEERQQRKEHRLYNIKHGLCIQCSKQAIKGQHHCIPCRNKKRERAKSAQGTEGRQKTCDKYYKSHQPKWRNYYYKKHYGISLEEYNQILRQQKEVCAICGKPNPSNYIQKRLYVDHDHKTGKVRGLLCCYCNWMLGHLREDIEVAKKAIEYITKGKGGD
jgi:hypothetical protein